MYLLEQQRFGTGPTGLVGSSCGSKSPSLFFCVSGSCATLDAAFSASILPMLSAGLGGIPWGNLTPCLVVDSDSPWEHKQIEEENLHSDEEKQGPLDRW